jgi:hypothetical protein
VILPAGTTALLNDDGAFLALYRQEGPDAIAEAVFVSEGYGVPITEEPMS